MEANKQTGFSAGNKPGADPTTQRAVLARVQAALPPAGVGEFCYVCGAPGVEPVETPEGETFVCPAGHRSPRAYIFDGKAITAFTADGLRHEAAGAIIRREAGGEPQFLLFLRQKYPYLYTIPAGHVESGRDPADEAGREVAEETGLTATKITRLWPDEEIVLHDPCRRGADYHQWYVYEVSAGGLPRLSDEGRLIGWYRADEIRELAAKNLLTHPSHEFMVRLGII